jgi:hypothetical protein
MGVLLSCPYIRTRSKNKLIDAASDTKLSKKLNMFKAAIGTARYELNLVINYWYQNIITGSSSRQLKNI